MERDSMERDGVSFSLDIISRGPVWNPALGRNQTVLEIHPEGEVNGNWENNNGTLGCIGLQCNAPLLNDYVDRIQQYLSKHSQIKLTVNY